jgi:hypothetical protein
MEGNNICLMMAKPELNGVIKILQRAMNLL